ncbi:MAG: Hsp20/alpha crystallin family protein [Planctomycetota bacterium]
MSKDDVEITVENGVLTLRGEKEQTEEKEEKNYHRVERRYGRFERSFRLPEYADETNADATFSDGILTITLPKKEAAKAKTIEVQGE